MIHLSKESKPLVTDNINKDSMFMQNPINANLISSSNTLDVT